jgi:hypothetical protein
MTNRPGRAASGGLRAEGRHPNAREKMAMSGPPQRRSDKGLTIRPAFRQLMFSPRLSVCSTYFAALGLGCRFDHLHELRVMESYVRLFNN